MSGKRQQYINARKKRPISIPEYSKGVIAITAITVVICFILVRCGGIIKQNNIKRYHDGQTSVQCLAEVEIPKGVSEIKVDYTGFTISYNPQMHQPNYGAWELTASKAQGDLPRKSKFRPDPEIDGCASLDDYRNSGFDRGHIVPAGDMKWDTQAMDDSHYLTNISPQEHNLNGGRWATLENKCREWAIRDSVLIIIAGPILSDEMPRHIGKNEIPVPERFFKVILSPYTIPPRAIGFVMPNQAPQEGLEALAVSVDQVEAMTGFDFFGCLPDDIENEIESKANYRQWNFRK